MAFQSAPSGNEAAKIDDLARCLERLVEGRPVALFDWPSYANAGDHFIWLGEKVIFKHRLRSKILYECSLQHLDFLRLARLPPEAIFVMHGGGNFGDLHSHHHRLREAIIAAFPDRRIVLMPQTVWFHRHERLKQSARVLSLHSDLHIIARDQDSFETLTTRMGLHNCHLHIDSAFALQPIVTDIVAEMAMAPERDVVHLLRRDAEASDISARRADALDWATQDDLAKLVDRGPAIQAIAIARDIFDTEFDAKSWGRLCAAIRLFGTARRIVTDRLHGHILAVMMGMEHDLYDNSYGKNSAFCLSWTNNNPLLRFVGPSKRSPSPRAKGFRSPATEASAADSKTPPPKPLAAIVTPYFKESRATLERCIRSVREQTVPVDHILVADGFPQDWIDQTGVRHVRLDRSHGDYGDAARSTGSMIAVAEGYEGIGFLDADCWLEPDHVGYCLELAEQAGVGNCDYVIALSRDRRPDGSIMNVRQVPIQQHVDTNCFFFLKSGFHILPVWGLIPREASIVGDRVFYLSVKSNGLRPAVATRKTVNYTCMWASVYRVMGEEPPEGAKPNPDHERVIRWIEQLSESDRSVFDRRIRAKLAELYPGPSTSMAAPTVSQEVAFTTVAMNEQAVESARGKICLSMIVKNEAPVIRRCLDSVRPIIDYWVIVDTGSTDGTQDIIREHFRDLPGELHERPWRDFAYNRSEALALARPHADYSLIIDADDALEIADGYKLPELTADSYSLEIRESNLTYLRTQLVRNALPWRYEGVLHEYPTCDGAKALGQLPLGIRRRHDGARRRDPKTYEKDAALLERALLSESNPHLRTRYTYYLGQSYRDCGRVAEAAEAYAKRAEMGGWDEEAWSARLHYARCLLKLKDEAGFVREALAAFDQRPHRAEPLYDLARFYRERRMHQASVLFSEAGVALPHPQGDTLFIEDAVYRYGLKEEYSIAANYARDPARKSRGFDACNWLALSRQAPSGARGLARHNLRFYVEAASKCLPSFAAHPLGFAPPDGARATSPSVARDGERIALSLRAVRWGTSDAEDPWPADDRNFLLRLDNALDVESAAEVLPPADPRELDWREAGESRLFTWRDALWRLASLRDPATEGRRRQALARVDASGPTPRLADWRALMFDGPWRAEETWAPIASGEDLRFLALFDPLRVVDADARKVSTTAPPIAADSLRAATPAVAFDEGWLMLVYEALGEADADRVFHHRWVWLDEACGLRRISRPFFFHHRGKELAAGLAWRLDGIRLIVSYGVDDREAWLATIDADDVRRVLGDASALPWGMTNSGEGRGLGAAARTPTSFPDGAETEAAPPPPIDAPPPSQWAPDLPMAGTELMVAGLRERLGSELDRINLTINHPGRPADDKRPCVVWIHHDTNQTWVQWCRDKDLVDQVARFVFVSNWQRDRYQEAFSLPAERCVVLRNATDVDPDFRTWAPARVMRCAYASTPFRGLAVLLEAWRRVNPSNAELHVWSSMKLYGEDDGPYRDLYAQARSTPGVIYRGIVPNSELRRALRDVHFLTYPSTFPETSCLAVIEAMAAGCRVIAPSLGALPETAHGFARLYPWSAEGGAHATTFADVLADELVKPWAGEPERALEQERYCADAYDWASRVDEWRRLLASFA